MVVVSATEGLWLIEMTSSLRGFWQSESCWRLEAWRRNPSASKALMLGSKKLGQGQLVWKLLIEKRRYLRINVVAQINGRYSYGRIRFLLVVWPWYKPLDNNRDNKLGTYKYITRFGGKKYIWVVDMNMWVILLKVVFLSSYGIK